MLRTTTLGREEEGSCFDLGVALEKRQEWRLAGELFFALMQHLGANPKAASDMYAHAAVRCASLVHRVEGVVLPQNIPVLCSHLRVCFLQTLGQQKICQRFPSPRKILEWLVHLAVGLNSSSELATGCWRQVKQALEEGGDQALAALMHQRSAEEQTQLLRLLGHHARTVLPAAAEVVADVLQRLLAPLAADRTGPLKDVLCKPNDAAVWMKTIATTLEALMLHLPYSSHQHSLQVLNWAEDFVANLLVVFPGVLSWQSLYALLSRGRLRALEAFRRSSPQWDASRWEIFDAWKKPLFHQFESLALRQGRQEGEGCEVSLPAKLLPLFQLAGLLRPSTGLLDHLWQKNQGLESLRLQLPPGPVSAVFALCQLQLHHRILSGTSLHSRFHCQSFGRLVISLATDPDFRKAIDTSDPSGSSLALRSVGVQLQRSLVSSSESASAKTHEELGRLRYLQVQASVLHAQIDGDTKECERLMGLALDDWQRCLCLETSLERTPSSFLEGLQAAGLDACDSRQLQRDLSDAAYLLEMLDLHALCVRALAFCVASTVQQYGRNVLLWLQGAKEITFPKSICEVCLTLFYRLVAAASKWERDSSGHFNQVTVLEWWKFAEAKRTSLGPVAPMVLTQRTHALSSLSEKHILSEWRSGGCRPAFFNAEHGLQDPLTFAEAFWSWSLWSGHWQETRSGQCPGGCATGAQTAALRSMKLLFHGPKVYSQGPVRAPAEAASELLRWPAWRSALLQLRVIHQVSLLYDCLGEAELAVACADCGLQLMQRKLCGDARWKLRFLCLRTRCAVSCFPDAAKEENALREIEDLWNHRIRGQPPVELLKDQGGLEETDGESMTMPSELLSLWVKMSLNCPQRRARLLKLLQVTEQLPSERLVLLMPLMDGSRWTPVQHLLDTLAHHPSGAPFPRPWCRVLALLAQAMFNELKASYKNPPAAWSLMKAAADLEHCCIVLSMPMEEIMKNLQVSGSLESFLQVAATALRGALLAGESAVARHCAQLLVGVADVVKTCTAGHLGEEETKARSRSPIRERGDLAFARAHWKLCKQVVPLGGGVSLLFITELRAMQRQVEKMDHESAFECLERASGASMNGVVAVEDLCSGNWMSHLTADMSLAWLQVDWRSSSLQITRSVDLQGAQKVVSQRLPLKSQVLNALQDELQQLHRANTEKIKELWQRQDKKSEAARLEFWRSRKGFDDQLGRLVQKIQKEVLGVGHFLLSAWPQSDVARQRVLDAVHSWLRNEATAMAEQLHIREEETEHFFFLALLLMEAEHLEVNDLLWTLGQLWDGSRSTLRRLAYSMRRYSSQLRQALEALPDAFEVPLLLYVDGVMAQFPLEACPCLRQRNVVRGLAPSITLSAQSFLRPAPSTGSPRRTGFFVIDPAEDCAAMGDVRQLLTSWSSHDQAWQGHTGKLPEPARVLEELCRKDVFVYLGHGERARELLRHEKLQIAGGEEKDRERCGLRSILMLLGCSSVKIQRSSFEGDHAESFGLASNALLGGAPLVLGAQWDVLGGDLDKLASRLLQRWLKEGTNGPPSGGLLRALKELRPKCLLPNLTGAALVCYGIPV